MINDPGTPAHGWEIRPKPRTSSTMNAASQRRCGACLRLFPWWQVVPSRAMLADFVTTRRDPAFWHFFRRATMEKLGAAAKITESTAEPQAQWRWERSPVCVYCAGFSRKTVFDRLLDGHRFGAQLKDIDVALDIWRGLRRGVGDAPTTVSSMPGFRFRDDVNAAYDDKYDTTSPTSPWRRISDLVGARLLSKLMTVLDDADGIEAAEVAEADDDEDHAAAAVDAAASVSEAVIGDEEVDAAPSTTPTPDTESLPCGHPNGQGNVDSDCHRARGPLYTCLTCGATFVVENGKLRSPRGVSPNDLEKKRQRALKPFNIEDFSAAASAETKP